MVKEMPHVLDRNGREIKLGDRVRIVAKECNQFLHDWYAECWIPEMHWKRDEYGTAKIVRGSAQIVDENDDVWWELDACHEGVPEKCLEVVDA